MPVISLAEVAANSRTIEVDIGMPETLTVTFRVSTITPADELILANAAKDGPDADNEQLQNYTFALAKRLIKDWGFRGPLTAMDGTTVVVKDGQPVPLEPDALRALPSAMLTAVLRGCITDINDPKASTAKGGK